MLLHFLVVLLFYTNACSSAPLNPSQTTNDRSLRFVVEKVAHTLHTHPSLRHVDYVPSFTMKCDLCWLITRIIQLEVARAEPEVVPVVAQYVCETLLRYKRRVCAAAIALFETEVFYVVNHVALGSGEDCGLLYGPSCGHAISPWHNWSVQLPLKPKPPILPPKPPPRGSPTIRILHISDLHIDHLYAPGVDTNCNQPVCCRKADMQGTHQPSHIKNGAGYWGDYRNCDVPWWTVEHLFKHLATVNDFDVIYWTGDLPSHHVWNQTRQNQLQLYRNLTGLFLKYFHNKTIISAMGNHESAPVNSFPPHFVTGNKSIDWLYNKVSNEYWKSWVSRDQQANIRKGGFYARYIANALRVVSINMNYCNNLNWWLLLNTTDPENQLHWLIEVLQDAEDKHEKVHIVGHIPPGSSDCLAVWSKNYYRIIDRYESTITGQFFGHTHIDHFEVFYDLKTRRRPTNVAFIAPSVTTFPNLNPGYRIYQIDGERHNSTYAVLHHQTYIMNLTEANAHGGTQSPTWQLEYDTRAAYGMRYAFPHQWDALISEVKHNDTLWQTFYRFMYKSRRQSVECDSVCRADIICRLKRAGSHDTKIAC